MIKIAFLADHLEVIPQLSQWFLTQWPEYYGGRTPEDNAQDFVWEANRDGLPVRLEAFVDGILVGTITLRNRAISTSPEFTPGLWGLLVPPQHRGRGLGTELVRAGMNLALEYSFERVFATTIAARAILERLGWILVQTVSHGDEQLMLYSYDL